MQRWWQYIVKWLAFPFAVSCKGIYMESHDWWDPLGSALKVRYMLLLHHYAGRTLPIGSLNHTMHITWKYSSNIWQVLTSSYLSPEQWGFFLSMFKMIQVTSWRYCSKIYNIRGTATQIRTRVNTFKFDCTWRVSGDHFVKCMFRYFYWLFRTSPYIYIYI